MPIGEPSSARVVMMVTPVVKVLNASRNALGLKFAGAVITASYHPDSVVAVFVRGKSGSSSLWTNEGPGRKGERGMRAWKRKAPAGQVWVRLSVGGPTRSSGS